MKIAPLTVALLASGALVAGCSAPATTAFPPKSQASATSAPASPATSGPAVSASSHPASGAAACATAGLQVSLGGGAGAGMSQNRSGVQFRNVGSSDCTLDGYPGVSYVAGPDGHQVGAPATRAPDASGDPERVVTLAPGALASAPLDMVAAAAIPRSECKPVPVRGLRIYPPGQRAALFIPAATSAHGYGECSLPTKQPILIVGYLQPGVQPGGGDRG